MSSAKRYLETIEQINILADALSNDATSAEWFDARHQESIEAQDDASWLDELEAQAARDQETDWQIDEAAYRRMDWERS